MNRETVKQIIKEMISEGDLQIETWIEENNWDSNKLVTTIYYYDEESMTKEVIQETKHDMI